MEDIVLKVGYKDWSISAIKDGPSYHETSTVLQSYQILNNNSKPIKSGKLPWYLQLGKIISLSEKKD